MIFFIKRIYWFIRLIPATYGSGWHPLEDNRTVVAWRMTRVAGLMRLMFGTKNKV